MTPSIDTSMPFALAYLDWCKAVKETKSLRDTERHDWIMEFGRLYTDAGGSVNSIDIAIAQGRWPI